MTLAAKASVFGHFYCCIRALLQTAIDLDNDEEVQLTTKRSVVSKDIMLLYHKVPIVYKQELG